MCKYFRKIWSKPFYRGLAWKLIGPLSMVLLLGACRTQVDMGRSGSRFVEYNFQSSRLLTAEMRRHLGLSDDTTSQYVLYNSFTRDFMASYPGNEKLYIIGRRHTETQSSFGTLQEYYSLIAVVASNRRYGGITKPLHYVLKDAEADALERRSAGAKKADVGDLVKDFYLSVHDFDDDGKQDILAGFEVHRNQYQYYIYRFDGEQLSTILRPWNSFTDEEQRNGTAKNYSPFMREISADIYPTFIAEIELDFSQKINIDLSALANDLIRDGVYDKKGLVLEKKGIPHLDFNPILFPVNNRSSYGIRSVQQVRNRYGQIGIYVCNWFYAGGRWVPDEKSIEFLKKPKI